MNDEGVPDALQAVSDAAERGDVDKLACLLKYHHYGFQDHLVCALTGAFYGCQEWAADLTFVRMKHDARTKHGTDSSILVMKAVVQVVGSSRTATTAIPFALQWYRRRFGFCLMEARNMVKECWWYQEVRNVPSLCECACTMLTVYDSLKLLMYAMDNEFPPWYPVLVPKMMSLLLSLGNVPCRALPNDVYYSVVKGHDVDGDYVEDMLHHAQQLEFRNLTVETLALWQDRWPLRMQQCRAWSTPRAAWVCAVYRGVCSRVCA